MSIEKRYLVAESEVHYGKYVVIDTKDNTIHRFHNLASARTYAKQKNEEEKSQLSEIDIEEQMWRAWGDR